MAFKHLAKWMLITTMTTVYSLNAVATSPLPTSPPEYQKVDPDRLKRMHELVSGLVDEGKHAGAAAMVVRNGRIIDWQNWGKASLETGKPMQNDTIFRIYSMSKPITSVAVLQLYEQGKLRLGQHVTDIIPELKALKVYKGGTVDDLELEDVKRPITISMLLNHTAGFTYGFFNETPVHELYNESDLWKSESLDEFLDRAVELPLLKQPGEDFNYGISDDILAIVIQRVSGMPFEEYIKKNITDPLKMNDTAYDLPKDKMHRLATVYKYDDNGKLEAEAKDKMLSAHPEKGRGINSGGGGMFGTIGDYARFAQCILNGGELDGARILGRKTIELAMRDSLPEGSFAFAPVQGWGLISGLQREMSGSMSPVTPGTFTWSGAATTHFFADPTENLIGIVMVQQFPYDPHQLFEGFRSSIYQALE